MIVSILTQAEKDRLWDEVRAEFPHDEMMQQVHFVRLVHYYQTKNLTPEERVKFYAQSEKADLIS